MRLLCLRVTRASKKAIWLLFYSSMVKENVLIDTAECAVEGVNCVSFNDEETIVNISFLYFRWNGSCIDGHLFDCFHT